MVSKIVFQKLRLSVHTSVRHLTHNMSQCADVSLIKLFITRKKLLQHESITPIESGVTLSQIQSLEGGVGFFGSSFDKK